MPLPGEDLKDSTFSFSEIFEVGNALAIECSERLSNEDIRLIKYFSSSPVTLLKFEIFHWLKFLSYQK